MKIALLSLLCASVVPTAFAAPACCDAPVSSDVKVLAPLHSDSLYQVASQWTDDTGKTLSLADGRGRVRVVGMFYSSCPGACPRLMEKLQKLDTSLSADIRERVEFVLVSFDPETDTPSVLHTFRQNRQLTDSRWRFLSGAPSSVRELAALLDVKFKKEANGTIAHSNVITVLDQEGAIAYQEPGLNVAGSKLSNKIVALLSDRASTP